MHTVHISRFPNMDQKYCFDMLLIESTDKEAQLSIYRKNMHRNRPMQFKLVLFRVNCN